MHKNVNSEYCITLSHSESINYLQLVCYDQKILYICFCIPNFFVMGSIMDLPEEMIAIIFGYKNISMEDINNFRCTCTQFEKAVKYDKYQEKKFSQRWPSAKKLFDKMSKENEKIEDETKGENNEQKDKIYSNFMETGIKCAKQLRSYLSQIIDKHYDNAFNNKIDNFVNFNQVFQLDERLNEIICKPENFINNYFFMDELKSLIAYSPRRTDWDLTERYCYMKMFHYLRQYSSKKKWEKFKAQSQREQLLERAATIVAQWFQSQKDVYYSCVNASLDNIVQEVLKCLKEKYPDHSIFSSPAENLSYWKNNNIDDNHWNEAEGTQIMDTLEEYIFGTLNFTPNESTSNNLKFFCIDNVLENKYGEEIILLITYHSVARRLGLRCDVIKLTRFRRCIFWKPNYATNNSENIRCFNISFNKFPNCLVKQQCPEELVIPAKEILQEMLDILITSNWYNNSLMVTPQEMNFEYIWLIGLKELCLDVNETEKSNTRLKDVKFSIGMIIKHQQTKYDQSTDSSAGVIVGWLRYTDICNIQFSIKKLTEPALPLRICSDFSNKEQTYYIILNENNEMCYVDEDDLTTTTPKWIDNSEIGRYFSKFEETHYVPNKMLAGFYPHDAAITARISDN
ncbi:F-box only protein 21-like [Anoplolepis gracilipes]|uniref:F-box only protein 21-like n=1 Tax=Anoplolepis gracilipes TaxID=354296 RepID=UPI003BA32235